MSAYIYTAIYTSGRAIIMEVIVRYSETSHSMQASVFYITFSLLDATVQRYGK